MSTLTPNVKREFINNRYFVFTRRNEGIEFPDKYKYTMDDDFAISFWIENPTMGTLLSCFSRAQFNGIYIYINTTMFLVLSAHDWRNLNGGYVYYMHGMGTTGLYNILLTHEAGYRIDTFKLYINNNEVKPYYSYDNLTNAVEHDDTVNVTMGSGPGVMSNTPVGMRVYEVSLWNDSMKSIAKRRQMYGAWGKPHNLKNVGIYKSNDGWYRFQNKSMVLSEGMIKDYSPWGSNATCLNINSNNIRKI